MAKIWRNRIEAGTQRFSDCPLKYRNQVIALIQADLASGAYMESQLRQLVEDGMMTEDEYEEITGNPYVEEE